ncbi:MAG: hypothetical protein PHQ43_04495 [Dehalococcoidales bacterium]|nr:hypothetical protein [Dehalococcoidales bacterium]
MTWVSLDDKRQWMGVWDEDYTYALDDTVQYKTTNGQYHVFISKAGHNRGNTPTTSPAYWRRLQQEPWT